MKFAMLSSVMLFTGFLSSRVHADAVVNGDFSDGNRGFTSGYTFAQSDPPNVGGHYTVDTTPTNFNSGMGSFPDHTTGTGPMLIVDGSTTPGVVVWQETVQVAPNTVYQWSAFAASAGQANGNLTDQSPATLEFLANSNKVGSLALFPQDDTWQQFGGAFNSGPSSSAVLSIFDTNTAFLGNDFLIDDISLTPEPSSLTMVGALGGLLLLHQRRRK